MSPASKNHKKSELMEIQANLEKEMTAKGAERFYKDLNNNKSSGTEDNSVYGSAIMKHKIDAFALIIREWKESHVGKGRQNGVAIRYLKELDNHMLSYLTLKALLSRISLPITEQAVAISIAELIEEELQFENLRKQDNTFVQNVLHKGRHANSKHRKKLYIRSAIEQSKGKWEMESKWPRKDKLIIGVLLIHLAEEGLELITVRLHREGKNRSVRRVHPNEKVQDWIKSMVETVAITRPVREPMVVPPRDWSTPWDGGYITRNIAPLKLVKVHNKNYLKELSNTDMPIVYTAVNALQRTPWQINTKVMKVMDHFFQRGVNVGGIPPREDMAIPQQPEGSVEGDEEYKAWKRAKGRVWQHNQSLSSTRISFHMGLELAKRYNKYKEIYFPYQLDFRGRIYAVPYLNPQSSDHIKSLIRFAYGKPLGAEGWKWLAIHGANVAGNDKITLPERVEWVLDHEKEILDIAENPYDNLSWDGTVGGIKIDSPWQFLSFCFEWQGYVKHGEGYVSKIPIALDGSCSGIQHFSAMLRDEVGGAAVNLVPSEKPSDVYRIVADEVIKQLEYDSLHEVDYYDVTKADGNIVTQEGKKTLARQWLQFGVTRKTTKRSVMTLAYGSRQYGFRDQLMEDIIKPAYSEAVASGQIGQNSSKFPFSNDGYIAATYMAGIIWEKVKRVLVKATEAMDWLQECAQLLGKEGLPIRWSTPCGFPVLQEYYDTKARRVLTNLNGKSVEFQINEPVDKISKAKQIQGVSPNFVHSMDASHMMLTIVRAKQEGLFNFAMIHDSFGTCAGDTEDMFRIVRESFVEMYSIDVFQNFRDEVEAQLLPESRENLPPLPSAGHLDLTNILSSLYCFA